MTVAPTPEGRVVTAEAETRTVAALEGGGMSLSWPNKDADEVLDYALDWSARLGTDTIKTSTWAVPTGIDKLSDAVASGDSQTVIWLSGGVLGKSYKFTNRIVTDGGRTMDQSVMLAIAAK